MESSLGGLNYEEDFQDLVEVVDNLECTCLLCRDKNYIHQAKHDGLSG